jgi:DNA-binding NarL/FixJ family response regulator
MTRWNPSAYSSPTTMPHFREGRRALLRSTTEVDVVGEAADGEGTIALASRLKPDVIVMDIKMPGTGG